MSEDQRKERLEREVARRLARIERSQKRNAASPNTLNRAAIDGTRIPVKDADGKVTAYLGGQTPGENPVQPVPGPKPNTPEAPELEARVGAVVVEMSGMDVDVDEHHAPDDFKRTEIHFSLDADFSPSPGTQKGSTTDPADTVTIGVAAGTWFVRLVWVTDSDQRSEPSLPVSVDVVPPVDAQDIQDTLDEAQERIDAARDEAEPRFEALETGLQTNESNIADATGRIAAAEQLIEPLPGQMAETKADVEAARDEAAAASAAAVEANNRSMTRLANGNFDRGLDYWVANDAFISDDAHSGSTAALIASGGSLYPESSMPVVSGQIWELSLYSKADDGILIVAPWVADEYGEYLAELDSEVIDATGAWHDLGALRFEIPDNAGFLNFTLLAREADQFVDDVTLRDVTDVVRLEKAARAAAIKADDVQAAHDLLSLIVVGEDGQSGLVREIADAQDNLENIDTELDQVATNLGTALTGPVDHDRLRAGTGAFDEGFIGELWAGNIRALAAELASLIVASPNMLPNGTLTQGDQFWELGNAQIVTDDTPPGYEYAIRRDPNDGSLRHNAVIPVQGGQEYLWELWIKADRPDSVFFWDMRDQDGSHVGHPDAGGYVEALEPPGHSTSYWRPISEFVVPTEWTRVRSVLKPGPEVTSLSMAGTYFNHANGAERNATVSIAGLRMTPRAGAEVLVDGSVTAEKVTATKELITKIFSADLGHVIDLIVEGDLFANNATLINAAMQNLSVSERLDFVDAFGDEIYSRKTITDLLVAGAAWIDGTLIEDDSIKTKHLTITGEMAAALAKFGKAMADEFVANQGFIDTLGVSDLYLGSESADTWTRVDGTGLKSGRRAEGEDVLVARFGGGDVGMGFFDEETGLQTGGVDPDGTATFNSTSVRSLDIGGRELVADVGAYQPGTPVLDSMPRGIWRAGPMDLSDVDVDRSRYGFMELSAPVEAGRVYRVSSNNFLLSLDHEYRGVFRYTISDNGETIPTVSNDTPELHRWIISNTSVNVQEGGRALLVPDRSGVLRVLFSIETSSSARTGIRFNPNGSWSTSVEMWLEDLGAVKPTTFRRRFSALGGPDPYFPDDAPGLQTYRTEWGATWYRTYRNDGNTPRTDENYGVSNLVQGHNRRFPGEVWTSLAGFSESASSTNSGEVGKTLRDALTGAEIVDVALVVHGGGTTGSDTRFFPEIHWASPTVASSTYRRVPSTLMVTPRVDPGWTRETSIPARFWPLLATGDWNSIGLAKNPNSGARYDGWLSMGDDRPRLIVTYQK